MAISYTETSCSRSPQKGQDSSRGSHPPQQLDLAQSFNDMRTSRSSTSAGGASNKLPSRSSQPPVTLHSHEGSLVPPTPHYHYNHLVPFLPCSHAISKSLLPVRPISI